MLRSRSGQSVLEYVIVVTVVIGALVVFFTTAKSDTTKGLGKMLTKAGQRLATEGQNIADLTQ